ncbi:alpha/beta fold hydrolase [Streptomyces coeruleorubidus]|uniref:alpha/beta fold hydrolase n=1 Tax=Streptomyces coeruleorubidus TaxID=116188 RepID=UPI00237F058F|nr:alpha/beta fold hydrolase [Streptomyces coeruleorubidus]WDV51495.1 alpha/beta fold hydrolase [Streptomyces coeruleorubidus]
MPPRLPAILTAAALAVTTAVLSPASPATADTTDISPPGANDWSCKPTAEHPEPVVLVHGTFETMAKNWPTLSPKLKSEGYCVFALNYGGNAMGPIAQSAKELKSFVGAVMGATGARKVDLVGHSQGGMMPRYYIKYLGGATQVDDLVGIVPSNHGTEGVIAPTPELESGENSACPACDEQQAGSEFLTDLNAKDETPAGPYYTVVTTRYDEVVTPYTSAFLDGSDREVTNITLQDRCPLNTIEHDQTPNDPVVHQWVLNALERKGPADPAFVPSCVG